MSDVADPPSDAAQKGMMGDLIDRNLTDRSQSIYLLQLLRRLVRNHLLYLKMRTH